MTADINQDYFVLLGIVPTFRVDHRQLAENYRNLQKTTHPDKFINESDSEQLRSAQLASYVNGAYQTLKSPLLTAEYLLELAGHSTDKEALTVKNNDFLFKQMQWREILSELEEQSKQRDFNSTSTLEQLEELSSEVAAERKALMQRFEKNYDEGQLIKAAEDVAQWHFIEKVRVSIDLLEDKILE
ncbi:MAG: molecular chaperone HscB [Cellvibrionaceae bacterium]|jgi:molecular chaperone HscB